MLSDGENTVQAKQWLDECYLNSAPSEIMVKRGYADFKHVHTDTNDGECSGLPNSAVVLENTKKFHKLILANHKLKLYEIAEELKIFCMSICQKESCVQSGCHICSQLIKNVLTIQSIVCNCFNATKKSFCIDMWQWMKPGLPLYSGVKLAVSWGHSSWWKPSKVTKDENISRQSFGLHILGCAMDFFHRLPWERKNHQ